LSCLFPPLPGPHLHYLHTARIRHRDSGAGATARRPDAVISPPSSPVLRCAIGRPPTRKQGNEDGPGGCGELRRWGGHGDGSGVLRSLLRLKPELAARRIEAIGFQVGHQLSERYTMERPRFSDHLEAIKFICKDFWSELFKKQIDNLKTNHRGTFVLQDNRFRWLTRVSLDPSAESTDATDNDSAPLGDTAAQTTSMLLYFPCGLIRGALTNLGISCSVSADMSNLPACSFVVRIKT